MVTVVVVLEDVNEKWERKASRDFHRQGLLNEFIEDFKLHIDQIPMTCTYFGDLTGRKTRSLKLMYTSIGETKRAWQIVVPFLKEMEFSIL